MGFALDDRRDEGDLEGNKEMVKASFKAIISALRDPRSGAQSDVPAAKLYAEFVFWASLYSIRLLMHYF